MDGIYMVISLPEESFMSSVGGRMWLVVIMCLEPRMGNSKND